MIEDSLAESLGAVVERHSMKWNGPLVAADVKDRLAARLRESYAYKWDALPLEERLEYGSKERWIEEQVADELRAIEDDLPHVRFSGSRGMTRVQYDINYESDLVSEPENIEAVVASDVEQRMVRVSHQDRGYDMQFMLTMVGPSIMFGKDIRELERGNDCLREAYGTPDYVEDVHEYFIEPVDHEDIPVAVDNALRVLPL